MEQYKQRRFYFLLVIISALFVYIVGHFEAITNPYVINDDVRQQIYWMQRWSDPELFQNDYLTRYAENYVPIGVKSIYYAFSGIINPVQFSKVLTGFLFVVNAVLLFMIGAKFSDDFTALILAISSFLFTSVMTKISGGMSQSFAYPLLLAYVYFLASENLLGCSLVIMVQSIFNPYIFVLCSVTHAIYLLKNFGNCYIKILFNKSQKSAPRIGFLRLIGLNIPILMGGLAMIYQHVFLRTSEFGDLISWLDIFGNIEYTSSGRYQLAPGPDLYWELFRPIVHLMLYDQYGPVIGTISGITALIIVFWAVAINKWDINLSRMSFLIYLAAASLILYFVSYEVIMRLFLPRRYIEFSFNLIYWIIFAACLSSILKSLKLRRAGLTVFLVIGLIVCAWRIHNVGIYDYSKDSQLYDVLVKTPKNSIIAGPPEVMDNVVTFAKRKAFVTYELSHTWFTQYWQTIKERTFDFFDAYYANDPKIVREFARRNGVDYFVVREKDFNPENMSKIFDGFEPFGSVERSSVTQTEIPAHGSLVYFEPFQSYISARYGENKYFAVLDDDQFKPIFKGEGYRVIKLR